jgi:hypothetical protein
VVQGGMSSIAEATPAAKASPRWCRAASAGTKSRHAAGLVMDRLTSNYESDQVQVRDIWGGWRSDGAGPVSFRFVRVAARTCHHSFQRLGISNRGNIGPGEPRVGLF